MKDGLYECVRVHDLQQDRIARHMRVKTNGILCRVENVAFLGGLDTLEHNEGNERTCNYLYYEHAQ
jgi:hypothetical protein